MRKLKTPSLIVSTAHRHNLGEDNDFDTSISDGSGDIQVTAADAIPLTGRSTMFRSVEIEVEGNRTDWSDNSLLSEAKEMLEADYLVRA